jgi:membrane fusion protein, multidrug efflux system
MTAISRSPFPVSSLLLPVLLAGAAVACSRAEAAEKPAPTEKVAVTTTDVVERVVPVTLTVTGSLLANRESEVAADAAGRVIFAAIERGAFVKQGSVLAQLDSRSAALNRNAASAEVAAARAQRENANLECERSEKLFVQGAISKAELDRARTACSSSSSSTEAAVARQQLAAKAAGDATIRAPFSGMVVDRSVDVGEYVSPGRRVATVVEINPLRLELTIPESAASSVKEGGRVEFGVRTFASERFNGKIRYIGPVLRRATHDLVIEALVDNQDGRLRPGMFAEAELTIGERKLPIAPATALIGSAPNSHAFVVVGGVAEERVVLTGARDGDNLTILQGLRPGERVITHPNEEIRDGVRVR